MSTLPATLGALQIAILISSVLYGVTTLQAWLYAEKYSTDKCYLRIMVSVLPIFHDILMNTCTGWRNLVCTERRFYGTPVLILCAQAP